MFKQNVTGQFVDGHTRARNDYGGHTPCFARISSNAWPAGHRFATQVPIRLLVYRKPPLLASIRRKNGMATKTASTAMIGIIMLPTVETQSWADALHGIQVNVSELSIEEKTPKPAAHPGIDGPPQEHRPCSYSFS